MNRIKDAICQTLSDPSGILENPYTGIAGLIGTFGSFIADQSGGGYYIPLLMMLPVFIYGIWNQSRRRAIYTHEAIPLPIVINISNPASSENALNALFHLIEKTGRYGRHQANLAKYCNIDARELVFEYRNDIHNREMLQDFLKITRFNLERLKQQTPKNTTIHLAYIGPSSVGVLVGTMFGTDGVKIFQYNKSSDSYYPAIEVKDRRLKEDITEFEKLERQKTEKSAERVVVAIDVAAHKIRLSDPEIQGYGDLIHLKSRCEGTIAANEDWLQYCREIFKVLNLAQQQGYEEIKLVYSMPVALAIAVGMAAQNYWPILLTNYDKATNRYRDLMRLNELTYYF